MNIDTLLTRLESVRPTNKNQWKAKCPAHEDKNPSLSVREVEDGRILIHCFAGCDVHNILASVNLEMRDLHPEYLGNFKSLKRPFPAADVLRAVGFESLVVINSGNQLLKDGKLNFVEKERLSLAINRIQAAINLSGVDA